MKKTTLLFFLSVLTMTIFGQTETETIQKANDLITSRKYESAFKLLADFDSKNEKPDIVLLKEDIVLNYFVKSIMHNLFGLKDLDKNENIMDLRGSKEIKIDMHMFNVEKTLEDLIKLYPDNCKLYKGLADFYYEVQLNYGDNWVKNNSELYKLIEKNNRKAIEGNCASYLTYYVLGCNSILQERYKEGIPLLLKSIELNKNYATSYYNLAYAYLYSNELDSALNNAKISLNLYTDVNYKSDAARMIGQIYSELKDDKNAIEYYEKADKISQGNYYNLKPLLNLYVKTNNSKEKEITKLFFELQPTNPTIYDDLGKIYYNNNKIDNLITFFKEQLLEYKGNLTVLGNLNFYLGNVYLSVDKKLAKEYYLQSKKVFLKVFDKNHDVFKAIDDGIKQTEK